MAKEAVGGEEERERSSGRLRRPTPVGPRAADFFTVIRIAVKIRRVLPIEPTSTDGFSAHNYGGGMDSE